jgi:Domain of unknown function (DUF4818)
MVMVKRQQLSPVAIYVAYFNRSHDRCNEALFRAEHFGASKSTLTSKRIGFFPLRQSKLVLKFVATKMWPTIIACFVQFLLPVTIFFKTTDPPSSAVPSEPNILIVISSLLILADFKLFPNRYAIFPVWFLFAVKLIINFLLVEFGKVFVWYQLEHIVAQKIDMAGDTLSAAEIILAILVIAFSGTVIVKLMIFVRWLTAKFHEQGMTAGDRGSGEVIEVTSQQLASQSMPRVIQEISLRPRSRRKSANRDCISRRTRSKCRK